MNRPTKHKWDEGSTHHAVSGKEYDAVWDYVDQLEALINEQEKLLHAFRVKLDKLEQETIYKLKEENAALKGENKALRDAAYRYRSHSMVMAGAHNLGEELDALLTAEEQE